ncbi:MAG: hexokinase [Sedimentisphaerales bacterium]|jgi:hexokinase
MKKIKQNVTRFLRKHQMDYLDVDIDLVIDSFLSEMQRGLAGKKSTLDMIPTYIEVGADVPTNKRVIVVDAGGTNFRVATVYFDDQKIAAIENLRLYKMPGVQHEIGKDEFFKIMAGYLKDVVAASQNIGFCFSYAVEMFPNKDGRLIRFSKEIKAKDVVGQFIGENLNRALASMGLGGNKKIILLNDTVVTLLAGVGYQNRSFGSYIGFILGTGTNTCYVEKNSNIKKTLVRRSVSEGGKNLDLLKSQIINTESGNFGRIKQGKIDAAFDKSTVNPAVHKFEKMISGAYLGPLCLATIHKACDDGLFSTAVANALWQIPELDTKDMNAFLLYPYGNNPLADAAKQGNADDSLTLYYIADRLTERAAKLTAINLSAMAIKSGSGTDPSRPICIVAEGTTFYQMKGLKNRVEFYLKQYLENKFGIHYEIISVDNATLIGSAIAGLTN